MGWGISPNAPEKEKIKAEMADYLQGLNATGIIDIETYDEAFDLAMNLMEKMYESGKKESTK